MKILILFSFILFSKILFCHSEIFNMTDGQFLPDQKFDKHFSFDLTFHKDVFVDELGVDFIDLGIDNLGNFKIKIFRNDSILNETTNLFGLNFNQIAYFNINHFFQEGLTYTFKIFNLDIYSYNDNKITLFKPNNLPYTESSQGIFTTSNLKSSSDSLVPFDQSDYCPFVHIGTTNQNYIDLSKTDKSIFYKTDIVSTNRSTQFKCLNEIQLTSIGLLTYNSGTDNLSDLKINITDMNSSVEILKKDTVINNLQNNPFSIFCNIILEKNHTYNIEFNFSSLNNLDDYSYLYKPKNIPYTENTENIEITNFKQFDLDDSLGLPIKFYYNEILRLKNIMNEYPFILISNQKIIFHHISYKESFDEINIYDLTGKKLFSDFNISHNSNVYFNKDDSLNGFFVVEIISDSNRIYKTFKI